MKRSPADSHSDPSASAASPSRSSEAPLLPGSDASSASASPSYSAIITENVKKGVAFTQELARRIKARSIVLWRQFQVAVRAEPRSWAVIGAFLAFALLVLIGCFTIHPSGESGHAISTADPASHFGFVRVYRSAGVPNKEILGIKFPYPTNAWWMNLALGTGFDRTNIVNVVPYTVLGGSSLSIIYPNMKGNSRVVSEEWNDAHSLVFSTVEPLDVHRIVDADLLSVTMEWKSGGGSMKAPIVRGMAYVSTEIHGLTPIVSTMQELKGFTVDGDAANCNDNVRGKRFQMSFGDSDTTWVLYSSHPVTAACSLEEGFRLQAKHTFHGVLRLAMANNCTKGHGLHCEGHARDQSEFMHLLDNHAEVYPVGGDVKYGFSGDIATYTYEWKKEAMHGVSTRSVLSNSVASGSIGHRTIRGFVVPVVADTWRMTEHLPTATWGPSPHHYSKEINDALDDDKHFDLPTHFQHGVGDPYFAGKLLAKMAQIVLVAEKMGRTDVIHHLLPKLKHYTQLWFTHKSGNELVYDTEWGGLVSCGCDANWGGEPTECWDHPPDGCPAISNSGYDFGNGFYNDHHFHYGYHIYAAAVIAKLDHSWGSRWKENILLYVRDIANPSSADPYFPMFRHKDWYTGFSWASGIALADGRPYLNGRNQESSSEAVNAYFGISLLGHALHDESLQNLGRLLTATEIRSAKRYYHMTDASIYPEVFADNKMVGMLWSNAVIYQTWFNLSPWAIHAIQIMPVTPITSLLFPKSYVTQEFPILQQSCQGSEQCMEHGWYVIVCQMQAILDREQGLKCVQSLPDDSYATHRPGGNGQSKSNTLYWVAIQ